MQHLAKDTLTTKITKATKGSDIFDYKLRALHALRGDTRFFLFGCGSAALGPSRGDICFSFQVCSFVTLCESREKPQCIELFNP